MTNARDFRSSSEKASFRQLIRQAGRVDTAIMAGTHIVQIGVSRGLSSLLTLVRSGVANITLIDSQTVEADNINQTLFEERHSGMTKVEAAKDLILARAPTASVHTYAVRAQNIPNLQQILADAGVIKIGIDDPASMFELADLAQKAGTPAFLHAMSGDGRQHFTVCLEPDGKPLRDILPEAWKGVQAGYQPPAFFPSCALHTEVMNASVAMMIAGYMHFRAGSPIAQMSEIGAGLAARILATGFNGYHEPSCALTPIYFGLPD